MELVKEYECMIAYHLRKANVVADALSRKNSSKDSKGRIALLKELKSCKAILSPRTVGNLIAWFQVKPTLEEEIVKTHSKDPTFRKLAKEVKYERWSDYAFKNGDTLIKEIRRLWISNNKVMKESIMEEVHSSCKPWIIEKLKSFEVIGSLSVEGS